DLSACEVGQCKYVTICAPDGGIVNDPILLRLAEGRVWLSLADSDALLYALGVQSFAGMDVTLREPDVSPLQVQGPKSKPLVRALFGDTIADLRYYRCAEASLEGIPLVVSRTGWTGEVGYELYLRDASRGNDLWDRVMEAGRQFQIRAIAPSDQRRLEAGIFNYGNDMDVTNTPYEVTGLERLAERSRRRRGRPAPVLGSDEGGAEGVDVRTKEDRGVDSLSGQLLLSNASLFDPNFRRTVVLIGHHDDEGAVGVVLNRPFDVTVGDAVPPLADLVREGEVLFHGGPVQPEAAVVVADFEDPSEAGVVAFDSIGFLAEEAERVDPGTIRR